MMLAIRLQIRPTMTRNYINGDMVHLNKDIEEEQRILRKERQRKNKMRRM